MRNGESGSYKGVRYAFNGYRWYFPGCLTAGEFDTLAALRRFVDQNQWPGPRDAGG